jgi:hypothetical protein
MQRATVSPEPQESRMKIRRPNRSTVASVTVSPSSGTLASGASVVPRIRGSYPAGKQKFWVLFEYPTSASSASVNFDVSCS